MSDAPQTRLDVSADEAAAIRGAVRNADVALLGPGYRLVYSGDVPGLIALLSDPAVSDAIYDLPRPFSTETISAWIETALVRQQSGEAVLAVMVDDAGVLSGYSYFSVWPDRSAAEIGGAHRADAQNKGIGKAGAARSFGWMFGHLGVRLIGVTAALDNVRSARVIEAAGFREMGQRQSNKPDGTTRQSRYWEMTSDEWGKLHGGNRD